MPSAVTAAYYAAISPPIPAHLTRSKQRCQEFVAKGETRSPLGWVPVIVRFWAQDAEQAQKARHVIPNCRITKIIPAAKA